MSDWDYVWSELTTNHNKIQAYQRMIGMQLEEHPCISRAITFFLCWKELRRQTTTQCQCHQSFSYLKLSQRRRQTKLKQLQRFLHAFSMIPRDIVHIICRNITQKKYSSSVQNGSFVQCCWTTENTRMMTMEKKRQQTNKLKPIATREKCVQIQRRRNFHRNN